MDLLETGALVGDPLPGRIIYRAAGKGGPIESGAMTVAFGRYSGQYGLMAPHRHAEECVFILGSVGGHVRWGATDACGNGARSLERGMLLRFAEGEWHVFEYEEGGHIDAMFIYGQVDDIRPEEKG